MKKDEQELSPDLPASHLSAAFPAKSHGTILAWVTEKGNEVTRATGLKPRAHIRAYRHGREILACDFMGNAATFGLLFIVDDVYRLGASEILVPDLAEGLHLAGLLANIVEAEVALGDQMDDVTGFRDQ